MRTVGRMARQHVRIVLLKLVIASAFCTMAECKENVCNIAKESNQSRTVAMLSFSTQGSLPDLPLPNTTSAMTYILDELVVRPLSQSRRISLCNVYLQFVNDCRFRFSLWKKHSNGSLQPVAITPKKFNFTILRTRFDGAQLTVEHHCWLQEVLFRTAHGDPLRPLADVLADHFHNDLHFGVTVIPKGNCQSIKGRQSDNARASTILHHPRKNLVQPHFFGKQFQSVSEPIGINIHLSFTNLTDAIKAEDVEIECPGHLAQCHHNNSRFSCSYRGGVPSTPTGVPLNLSCHDSESGTDDPACSVREEAATRKESQRPNRDHDNTSNVIPGEQGSGNGERSTTTGVDGLLTTTGVDGSIDTTSVNESIGTGVIRSTAAPDATTSADVTAVDVVGSTSQEASSSPSSSLHMMYILIALAMILGLTAGIAVTTVLLYRREARERRRQKTEEEDRSAAGRTNLAEKKTSLDVFNLLVTNSDFYTDPRAARSAAALARVQVDDVDGPRRASQILPSPAMPRHQSVLSMLPTHFPTMRTSGEEWLNLPTDHLAAGETQPRDWLTALQQAAASISAAATVADATGNCSLTASPCPSMGDPDQHQSAIESDDIYERVEELLDDIDNLDPYDRHDDEAAQSRQSPMPTRLEISPLATNATPATAADYVTPYATVTSCMLGMGSPCSGRSKRFVIASSSPQDPTPTAFLAVPIPVYSQVDVRRKALTRPVLKQQC